MSFAAFRRALVSWPLVLALYLPSAVLALLAAVPVFFGLADLTLLGPIARRFVEGAFGELIVEVVSAQSYGAVFGVPLPGEVTSAATSVVISLGLISMAIFVNGIAYAFLSGGVLNSLTRGELGFWRACRTWFWPMWRFGLISAPLGLIVWLATTAAVAFNVQSFDPLSVGLGVGVPSATLTILNGYFELGRASMVLRSDPRAAAAVFGAAQGATGSLMFAALLCWLALGVAGLLSQLVGAWFVNLVPATAIGASLAGSQLLALIGAWIKLARLGLAVDLARGQLSAPNTAPVEA